MSAPGGLVPGGWCVCSGEGGGIPACTEADPPPGNRMTNRCKNITLATSSLRPVKMYVNKPLQYAVIKDVSLRRECHMFSLSNRC